MNDIPLPPDAIAAAHRGDKVSAIKILNAERNLGILKSKTLVEDYIRTQPALQAAYDAADAKAKQAALRWFLVLIGLTILAALLMGKQ
jgi:hypothetical protein